MKAIESAIDRVEWIAIVVASACAVIIALVMAAQVFWRYVLVDPLLWSEPVSVYALVWLVFLGAAVITARWEHVSISSFIDFLPTPLRAIAVLFGKLAMVAFALAVAIVGYDNLVNGAHARAPVVGISTLWVKAIITVSAVAMVLFSSALAVRDMIDIYRRRWDRFPKTAHTLALLGEEDHAPDPDRPV